MQESAETLDLAIEWGAPTNSPVGGTRFKFEGKRVNRSVVGTLRKWSKSFFASTGSWDSGQTALAYCAENNSEFFVLEVGSRDNAGVHTLRRVAAADSVT